MSKPLTIEELKALEVGDWVWVTNIESCRGRYLQLEEFIDPVTMQNFARLGKLRTDWSAYGKTWLAYKNKEQAEAKGEIVELPCIRKTLVGYELVYLSQYAQIQTEMLFIDELPYAERRLAELKGEQQ